MLNFRLRSIHCECTFLNDSMLTVKFIIPWPTPKKSQDCKKTYLAAQKNKTLWSCVNVLSRNQNVWWSQNVWSRTRLKFLIVQIWYFAILPHPADAASLIFSPSSCSTLVLQKIFCSPAVRWRIFSIFPALSGNNYQQFCRRKTYLSKKTRRFL